MSGYSRLARNSAARKALLRDLITDLILNGSIKTTVTKANELKRLADKMVTLGKKNTLASRRQAAKFIFDKETGKFMDLATGEVFETVQADKKLAEETVLRKLFTVIGKKYSDRQGGYTRIFRLPPRRGDASEMALIQLV